MPWKNVESASVELDGEHTFAKVGRFPFVQNSIRRDLKKVGRQLRELRMRLTKIERKRTAKMKGRCDMVDVLL